MENNEFEIELGGRKLKAQVNNLAEQASGSVFLQYGDTTVLATAIISDYEREGIDFFPLSVEFEEKFYAAGRILGSRFMRREGKPTDEAILTSRFIDRAIRPRFPKGLNREVQVTVTCLSWDKENDPDALGLIAASLALSISDIPWNGPIASLKVAEKDGQFILNPTYKESEKSSFDLALAGIENENAKFLGNKKDNLLINMIEAEASEVEEKTILDAVAFAREDLKKIIQFQKEIIEKVGKEKITIEPKKDEVFEKELNEYLKDKLEQAVFSKNKKDLSELKKNLFAFVEEKHPDNPAKLNYLNEFWEDTIDSLIHEKAVKEEKRPDGRKLDEVREINTKVNFLPRTHGTGIFMRGQTKALSILTLGSPSDVKLIDSMEAEITGEKKRFMHHYNFPPYCSGEVKSRRGPGRREIGHGMLAEKAVARLIPDFDTFPYTVRIVTEILSSNGSTSMASVSSSILSLLDAGVPIKAPAAGIAMGLMQLYDGNYKILTDIQGPEDHFGDMDFKVAGTKNGITAIQMDVKIEGIGEDIFEQALKRAKKARLHILEEMGKTISEPRERLSAYAPKITILHINPEKIREVIGPGGKVINEIIDECGVSIDIEDSGRIFVTAEKQEASDKAIEWIKNITREIAVGETFKGKVKRILNFGAFVEILPGQEGLVHISKLAPYHVEKVEDVVKIGDIVPVKVVSIDEQGRINLSKEDVKGENNGSDKSNKPKRR